MAVPVFREIAFFDVDMLRTVAPVLRRGQVVRLDECFHTQIHRIFSTDGFALIFRRFGGAVASEELGGARAESVPGLGLRAELPARDRSLVSALRPGCIVCNTRHSPLIETAITAIAHLFVNGGAPLRRRRKWALVVSPAA